MIQGSQFPRNPWNLKSPGHSVFRQFSGPDVLVICKFNNHHGSKKEKECLMDKISQLWQKEVSRIKQSIFIESYYYAHLGAGIVLKYNADAVSTEPRITHGFRHGNGMQTHIFCEILNVI